MEKVLLHTPEGVRDVYGKECAVKLTIENSINKVFNIYGYHNIQTPTFEFFDIFKNIAIMLFCTASSASSRWFKICIAL